MRPIISVRLILKTRSFSTWALLDSGSDRTLINKALGKQLGVDFKLCKLGTVQGIYGQEQRVWHSELDIEVDGFPGVIKHSEIDYLDSPSVGILLGHIGFFEFFDVKFETANNQFEIELH